jgi:transcriptional regulator with XRE-family HTH domain
MDITITPVMPAKKPSQNAFGQRLVALRQARGLTQVQLAKATGMTQRAISYYEIEAEFPPAPALITLAQALEGMPPANAMVDGAGQLGIGYLAILAA